MGIDFFLSSYFLLHLRTPWTGFPPPKTSIQPSVIDQVTFTEITADPYLKSLQWNYFYPLTRTPIIATSEILMDSTDTSHLNRFNPTVSQGSSLKHGIKKMVSVEDSMEVILKLISKIQALDNLNLNIPLPNKQSEKPPA
jgi:hypothetical protein